MATCVGVDSGPIVSGDSLEASIDWGSTGLLEGPPSSVTYAVFDHATGVQVGTTQTVGSLAEQMVFVIDGDLLVNTAPTRRRLRLEVTGQFASDRKTLVADRIFVDRRLTP